VLNKNGVLGIYDKDGRELDRHTAGHRLHHRGGGRRQGQEGPEQFVKWDPYNVPIHVRAAGVIEFHDFIDGVTVKKEVDESTGNWKAPWCWSTRKTCIRRSSSSEGRRPTRCLASYYSIPAGAHVMVRTTRRSRPAPPGQDAAQGLHRTKDITGGLPRVAELFEARKPKDAAEIARIDGVVEFGGTARGRRKLIVNRPSDRRRGRAPHPDGQAHRCVPRRPCEARASS
jgi:DNA-directed RNA polymerase subunit beta'